MYGEDFLDRSNGNSLKNANHLETLHRSIPGMAIGSKLLSEQPARYRAEHGALRNAVRLKSVVVRVHTEQLYIYITLHKRFSNCGTQACDFYMVREQLSTEHLKKK